ncbi:hypothetical protein EXN70_31840 [Rhizobium rhizogenes]|nr:hypothetical protein EXN70_31840 [Rhizobium rhizogenes]
MAWYTASLKRIGARRASLQSTAVSQRRLGEEGAKVLRNAILTARPDLATRASVHSDVSSIRSS